MTNTYLYKTFLQENLSLMLIISNGSGLMLRSEDEVIYLFGATLSFRDDCGKT